MELAINTLAVVGACTLAGLAWMATAAIIWKVRWFFVRRQHRREYEAQQRNTANII